MWVMLSNLCVSDNEPPMYWPAVRDYVENGTSDKRPIEITPIPGHPGKWRITNGRHRYVAALLRGDSHVRARVHPPNV